MSFFSNHERDSQTSEVVRRLLVRNREREEKNELSQATPQEAKNHLNGLVEKVSGCRSLREVLLIYLFDEGKSGPLNKRDNTIVNEIETPRGWLPVSNEAWEKGMKSLAVDFGWDLESPGIEIREKEREEGGEIKETKLATIEPETDRSKGAHLWRIAKFGQDSKKLISLSYEVSWL